MANLRKQEEKSNAVFLISHFYFQNILTGGEVMHSLFIDV